MHNGNVRDVGHDTRNAHAVWPAVPITDCDCHILKPPRPSMRAAQASSLCLKNIGASTMDRHAEIH
eukprot:1748971-Alexandrium_andersonii.AAC.1